MRQIVDDEHLRVYGIVTRHIEFVTVGRLILLVDDVLVSWRFRQRESLDSTFIVSTICHMRLVSHDGMSAITPRVRNF